MGFPCGMNLNLTGLDGAGVAFFVRWLCEGFLNAHIRPAYVKWKMAELRGDRRARQFSYRFWCLLERVDCYPCRVEYAPRMGLYISASADPGVSFGGYEEEIP